MTLRLTRLIHEEQEGLGKKAEENVRREKYEKVIIAQLCAAGLDRISFEYAARYRAIIDGPDLVIECWRFNDDGRVGWGDVSLPEHMAVLDYLVEEE